MRNAISASAREGLLHDTLLSRLSFCLDSKWLPGNSVVDLLLLKVRPMTLTPILKQVARSVVLAALPLFLFASCASVSPAPFMDDDPFLQRDLDMEPTYQAESNYSYWNDRPGDGPLRVTLDLSEQTAYFFRGTVPIGKSRVATGLPEHRTPTGSFTITEKVVDKRSNLYGKIYSASGDVVISDASTRKHSVPAGGRFVGASMPYWMRLTSSGIGMHVGPIPNPGQPASHGCIRMPRAMAKVLFANSEIGTPVEIVP